MPARLIVNADDFGLTLGINRAIAELHRARALTSATLMATGPAFDDAVAIGRANPTLGVGCHIVLTDGIPLSPPETIPTLLGPDRETFRLSLSDFVQSLLLHRIRPEDIRREASAQILKLQDAGIAITHLDTHKHTHLFPLVSRILLEVAASHGIRAIRNPFEPAWTLRLGHGSLTRRTVVRLLDQTLGPAFRNQLASSRVASTQGTAAISATGDLNSTTLAQILAAIPPTGTWELVVHPGYNDAALDAITTRLRASREIEREALLRLIPTHTTTQLIHYGNLAPAEALAP